VGEMFLKGRDLRFQTGKFLEQVCLKGCCVVFGSKQNVVL